MASGSTSMHSVEELEPLLAASKINLPNLLPEVQCILFADDYASEDTMLMEVTEEMISQLENGATLSVRGTTEDSAVLCTESATFEVKLREVSNALLVSPDVKTAACLDSAAPRTVTEKHIQYTHGGFLELRPLVPRCARAKHLLEEAPFTGLEFEFETEIGKKFTLEELLETVQSSRQELRQYLATTINTCEIDGKIRLLPHSYVHKLTERVLGWAAANSLPWESIPDYEASSALLELEPESVMRDFFWPKFSEKIGDTLRLLPDAIARTYAAVYLSAGDKTRCDQFQDWWRKTVPSVLSVDFREELLYGLAYKTEKETPAAYIYLAVEDLPTEPDKRFRRLFQERKKWPRDELVAYLSGTLTGSDTVEKLLTKFTKTITMDGNAFLISLSLI
ncbi:putative Sister chromatid cohesion protein DCC1 [Hypsibius exemplaris]|uniref:Sister chromatid cohesion protein DCC1 n=1 Tax=Hypsibius exemplaris TaxID=2072580 RepID=A0A1W0WYA1_HYPEX|nr:putative Sister chromatid cohesion protein DCC1 [Hypsibius exemplaris]